MLFPIVYGLVMIMLILAIRMINADLLWLKYLLFALNFALYSWLCMVVAYKEGVESVKVLRLNDVERRIIVATGEYREMNLAREYKPWKGFVNGLSPCVPMLILMLIQTVCYIINPVEPALWPGAIASYIYLVIFAFFRPNTLAYTTAAQGLNYYFLLVAIPIYMLMLGLPYLYGAKKQLGLLKMVDDKHKSIYGEDE